jgi:hypothetical protein
LIWQLALIFTFLTYFIGMFSVLQLKSKFPVLENGEEVPLPEKTLEGYTTLNELTVCQLYLIKRKVMKWFATPF